MATTFKYLTKKTLTLFFQLKSANKLLTELKVLMIVCQENFYQTLKLQKRTNNKGVKSKKYAFSNKIWLNSKYIKTK